MSQKFSRVSTSKPGVSKPKISIGSATHNRLSTAGPSHLRRSGIPKYQLQSESAMKHGLKKSSRPSVERLARVSLASGKVTPNKAYTPVHSNYLAPSTACSGNRQSIDTMRSSIGSKRKCLWPLNEPSFKSRCIDKLIEFLQVFQYDQQCNRAILRSPTAKDFAMIFAFIYRHIDNSYKASVRIEDDIPKILKDLRYPVQMPRSSFLNVASPHTWPANLAMLAWLVDQVTIYKEVNEMECMFPSDMDASFNFEEMRFNSMVKMASDMDNISMHLEVYKCDIQEINEVGREEFNKLFNEKEACEKDLQSTPSLIDEIEQNRISENRVTEDKNKLVQFNEEFNHHCQMKKREMNKLELEIEEIDVMFNKIFNEIEKLKVLLMEQKLTVVEVQELKNHGVHSAVLIQRLQREKDDINQRIWNSEMSISKIHQALRVSTCDCQLLANNYLPVDMPEIVNFHIETQIPVWENEILPVLKNDKKVHLNNRLQFDRDFSAMKNENEKLEGKMSERQRELQKQRSKCNWLEDEITSIKKDAEREELNLKKECDRLNEDIMASRKNPQQSRQMQQKLHDAKIELDQLKIHSTEERTKGKVEVMKLAEDINAYCLRRKELVAECNAKMEEDCISVTKTVIRHN